MFLWWTTSAYFNLEIFNVLHGCLSQLFYLICSAVISTFKATEWLDIWLVGFVVFNATFNNISALSWQSVLLVEETGVPRENHRPVT